MLKREWLGRVKKTLVLHAGTHKTASTYIQNRLWTNRKGLERIGVHVLLPGKKKTGQHNQFAELLKEHAFNRIGSLLESVSIEHDQLLVSAEQLTQALVRKNCVDGLLALLDQYGYRLRIVAYLRDQPEYINSLYVQEVRKFYHFREMRPYVNRSCRKRLHWFDYLQMFGSMINNPLVETCFLPYGRHFGDPFQRLMDSQGWLSPDVSSWLPGDIGKDNDQPGVKGVWLALRVSQKMEMLGVNRKLLVNQSQYIRRYSIPRGWGVDRFFGLKKNRVREIRRIFRRSNNEFARLVWGGLSWRDVFQDLKRQPYNVLDESALPLGEMHELNELVDRVFEDIRLANPIAFSACSDSQ